MCLPNGFCKWIWQRANGLKSMIIGRLKNRNWSVYLEWGERTGHFRSPEWQETVLDLRRAKQNCKVWGGGMYILNMYVLALWRVLKLVLIPRLSVARIEWGLSATAWRGGGKVMADLRGTFSASRQRQRSWRGGHSPWSPSPSPRTEDPGRHVIHGPPKKPSAPRTGLTLMRPHACTHISSPRWLDFFCPRVPLRVERIFFFFFFIVVDAAVNCWARLGLQWAVRGEDWVQQLISCACQCQHRATWMAFCL